MGAVVSIDLTLKAGHKNASVLLPFLFGAWVLFPFIGLALINLSAWRWQPPRRIVIYLLSIAVGLGSLPAYSGMLMPADAKTAFIFLAYPLVCWVLIGLVIFVGRNRKEGK